MTGEGVDCVIVVARDGSVRYRDSLEREGAATLAPESPVTALLRRVRDWLRQPEAEQLFISSDLQLFGEMLFDYLLPGGSTARKELERTLQVVSRELRALRVSLAFDGDVIASSFPWELLVVPSGGGPRFLCHSPRPEDRKTVWPSWLARRLSEPGPGDAPEPPACPRVVLVVADVPGQSFKLVPGSALDELVRLRDRRQIELDTELAEPGNSIAEPTLARLEQKLQGAPADLVHIIAHGDPRHIKLHTDSTERRTRGPVREITPDELTGALGGRCPALIYLDACRTVEDGAASPFVRQLLGARVPAVLAMQYAISNEQAQKFGEQFYRTVFNESLDVAVNQARGVLPRRSCFAAPVLYIGGKPDLRLAAVRSKLVDCPSAKCREEGHQVRPSDTFCDWCGSDLEPCPRECGAVVLKGSAACRNCRKPRQPETQSSSAGGGGSLRGLG